MHVEHVHTQFHGLYSGLGNSIRYIMVFQVEEDLCLVYLDEVDDFRTAMGEKLLADLEHAHLILELLDKFLGLLKMLQVEGQYHSFLGIHAVCTLHKRLLSASFLLYFGEDVKERW